MLRQAKYGNGAEATDRAPLSVRLECMRGILDEWNLESSTLRAEVGYPIRKPVGIASQDRCNARPRGFGYGSHTNVSIVCRNGCVDRPKAGRQGAEKDGVVLEW
jgi:hypothetical protein